MILSLAVLLREIILMIGYFNNSSFPQPLTPEEEKEYLKKLMNGDSDARQVLIERNLRLVAHVIKKFGDSKTDKEDLISIGTVGLIKAINTFKPERGTRLATYAARCIQNEILMHFRSQQKNKAEVSLQEPLGIDNEGNEIRLEDVLSCDDSIIEKVELSVVKERLKGIMTRLKIREKKILRLRFGLNGGRCYTQKEIAKHLGISRSYVSRIEKRVIQKISEEFQC